MRLNATDDTIDFSKPVYVSLFGFWSKKSGYGCSSQVAPAGQVDRVALSRQGGGRPEQGAVRPDVYGYIAQDYDDSPDHVRGRREFDGRQTDHKHQRVPDQLRVEPERACRVHDRQRAQSCKGTLYYPAGYEPGKRYPMIVYMYERLSDNVHSYVVPSDTSYYNTSVFTSQGYFVFQPDIVFRPRQPGLSVAECVTSRA